MNETNGAGGAPRLAVFAINQSKDGEKRFWTRIGVAFTNRDGSTTLLLDALPLGTNTLQVREPRPYGEARPGGAVRPSPGGDLETLEVRS